MFRALSTSNSYFDCEYVLSCCDYVSRELASANTDVRLFSGDWATLGRLAAAVIGSCGEPLTEAEEYKLSGKARMALSKHGVLYKTIRLAFSRLPPESIGPLLFVASAGAVSGSKLVYNLSHAIAISLPQLRKYIVELLERRVIPVSEKGPPQ
jgi:Ethanolamine utilization protein EutJ (predicted chaperonin)